MFSCDEKIKRLSCKFELYVFEGRTLVDYRKTKNIVLDLGRQLACDLMFGLNNTTPFRYVALGTDATPPMVTDQWLNAELSRIPFDSVVRSGFIVTCSGTFGLADAVGSLNEIGVVSDAVNGVFYNRATFPTLVKLNSQTLYVVVTFFG